MPKRCCGAPIGYSTALALKLETAARMASVALSGVQKRAEDSMAGNPFVVVEDRCGAKLCLSLTKKDQHAITNENHSHLMKIKVFGISCNIEGEFKRLRNASAGV
ncbi:hypothetical protein [Massilia sp. erpn]|uniref:hypothetical protein n=1 Tax=Massilia sp. erpn TaxID=2738142 RepID=UPI002103F7C3|nr:hypothetical protein [Massilia sp. erpn]